MRRSLMALAASALVGAAALAPNHVQAAAAAAAPLATPSFLHPVQFYDDGRWERRRERQEWRQERDEARIAEAARREAYRIEAEREQRRAWRRERREQQYGYGPAYGYGGHQRGW